MLEHTSRESSYMISLNPPDYPFTVRFTDSVQVIRHGPLKGYFSCFQPEGVEVLITGAEGDWYRAKLSETQYAWINKNAVEKMPYGLLPPVSYLKSVRTYGYQDRVLIEFPLSGKHPYRIFEDNLRTIRIQLFGVTSDTDWMPVWLDKEMADILRAAAPKARGTRTDREEQACHTRNQDALISRLRANNAELRTKLGNLVAAIESGISTETLIECSISEGSYLGEAKKSLEE